jgi:hypothetical protein
LPVNGAGGSGRFLVDREPLLGSRDRWFRSGRRVSAGRPARACRAAAASRQVEMLSLVRMRSRARRTELPRRGAPSGRIQAWAFRPKNSSLHPGRRLKIRAPTRQRRGRNPKPLRWPPPAKNSRFGAKFAPFNDPTNPARTAAIRSAGFIERSVAMKPQPQHRQASGFIKRARLVRPCVRSALE